MNADGPLFYFRQCLISDCQRQKNTMKKKRTKQEIRKRNGKRVLIIAFIILILLVLFYFWYPVWVVNQLFDQLLGH